MTRMRWWIVATVAVGCGKSSSDRDKPAKAEDKPAEPDEPPRTSNKELASAPLTSVAAKAGSIAFTIDLPVALLKDAEVKDAYATWEPKHAWFDTPSFTVQFVDMPAQTEPSESPMPIGDDAKDRKIVRNEKLPDGAILTLDQRTDHAFYELKVCRGAASGTLCCSVIQRGDQGKALEAFDAIVATAEKVCRSVKPKV